jgi:hypothetical protein
VSSVERDWSLLAAEIEAADLPELNFFRQKFSGYRVTDSLGLAKMLLHWPMLLETCTAHSLLMENACCCAGAAKADIDDECCCF